MKRVERIATIATPPDELFAYLADLDNLDEWMAGIVSAEVTSGGELGVGHDGARRPRARQPAGRGSADRRDVRPAAPPRHHQRGLRREVAASLDLEPAAGDATELRFAMEIRGSMLTRFMEPMIAGAAGGEIDATLERLRARFAPARTDARLRHRGRWLHRAQPRAPAGRVRHRRPRDRPIRPARRPRSATPGCEVSSATSSTRPP